MFNERPLRCPRLALDAGVSVHIVRDYLLRGLLRPVACTPGGYGLLMTPPCNGCASCGGLRGGIGPRDAGAAVPGAGWWTATKRPRSLPCCVSSSSVGAKRWPIWKCSWPPCRPSRHSTRRKSAMNNPERLAVRDAQTDHRLPVGRTGCADLPLPPAHPRCRAGWHNRRCFPRRALGHRGARFDRPVPSVPVAGAAGIQERE